MRSEFIEANTLVEAEAAAPWAAEIIKVDGGYHAFESMADYDQWMRTIGNCCARSVVAGDNTMAVVKFFGGDLGADTTTFRCNLSEASSPLQHWDDESQSWIGTQYQCADARHRVSGMVDLCRELLADWVGMSAEDFRCQHTGEQL